MAPFSPETLKMLRGALKKSRLAQICRLKGRNTFENLVRAKPSFGGGRWDSTPKGWGPLGNHPLSWVRMPRMHCLGKKICKRGTILWALTIPSCCRGAMHALCCPSRGLWVLPPCPDLERRALGVWHPKRQHLLA